MFILGIHLPLSSLIPLVAASYITNFSSFRHTSLITVPVSHFSHFHMQCSLCLLYEWECLCKISDAQWARDANCIWDIKVIWIDWIVGIYFPATHCNSLKKNLLVRFVQQQSSVGVEQGMLQLHVMQLNNKTILTNLTFQINVTHNVITDTPPFSGSNLIRDTHTDRSSSPYHTSN